MSKLKTRRVWFRVPVTFKAESDAALEHVIRSFKADPSPACFGCNVDHGYYEWKQGRISLDAASNHPEGKS